MDKIVLKLNSCFEKRERKKKKIDSDREWFKRAEVKTQIDIS